MAVFSVYFRYPATKLVRDGGPCEQAECEADDVKARDGCLVGVPRQLQQQLAALPANTAPAAHTSASELHQARCSTESQQLEQSQYPATCCTMSAALPQLTHGSFICLSAGGG